MRTQMAVAANAYTLPARVRSYEVGRRGTVGLGTLLRYLEFLATEASSALGYPPHWYVEQGSAWLVREMRIVLGEPPGIGAELELGTWLSEWRKVQAFREYAIWQPATGRLVARARARWAYVERSRGLPRRVPDEMVARFSPLGPPMPPSRWPPAAAAAAAPPAGDHAAAAAAALRLTAREVEADVHQHINNCVYADWLSEALTLALARAPQLMGGRAVRPREFRLAYLRPVVPGERLRVETTLTPLGARALLAAQRILTEGGATPVLEATSRHLLTRAAM